MTANTLDKQRILGLDGLRALSLALVLQAHWEPLAFLGGVANWGRAGLLVFFVLSGFLITRILIGLHRSGRPPGAGLKDFYLRRIFRIQPVYYIALAFVILANMSTPIREDVVYHVLFLNNLSALFFRENIGAYGPGFPWWSLAVEEQFYLIWAPIVIFTSMRWWKYAIAMAFVLAIGWRVYAWQHGLYEAAFIFTLGNLDSLAAGALVALLVTSPRRKQYTDRAMLAFAVAGISLFAAVIALRATPMNTAPAVLFYLALQDLGVYLVAAPAVYFLATDRWKFLLPVLESRAAVFVGKRSYGAYVFHQVVAHFFVQYQHSHVVERSMFHLFGRTQIPIALSGPLAFCLFFPVTIGLAALSYKYLELPILRYRDRVFHDTAVPKMQKA